MKNLKLSTKLTLQRPLKQKRLEETSRAHVEAEKNINIVAEK